MDIISEPRLKPGIYLQVSQPLEGINGCSPTGVLSPDSELSATSKLILQNSEPETVA